MTTFPMELLPPGHEIFGQLRDQQAENRKAKREDVQSAVPHGLLVKSRLILGCLLLWSVL